MRFTWQKPTTHFNPVLFLNLGIVRHGNSLPALHETVLCFHPPKNLNFSVFVTRRQPVLDGATLLDELKFRCVQLGQWTRQITANRPGQREEQSTVAAIARVQRQWNGTSSQTERKCPYDIHAAANWHRLPRKPRWRHWNGRGYFQTGEVLFLKMYY